MESRDFFQLRRRLPPVTRVRRRVPAKRYYIARCVIMETTQLINKCSAALYDYDPNPVEYDYSSDEYYYGDFDVENVRYGDLSVEEKLEKLKSLREETNWEDKAQIYYFFRRFVDLVVNWKHQLPDLRDIFLPEEIELFLRESTINASGSTNNFRGQYVIRFVVRTGYKDEPEVDEDGQPLLLRTTPVHSAQYEKNSTIIHNLFKIYDRFDMNYTNQLGFTHFHAACRHGCDDVVEKFLELGQDPNLLVTKTGHSPLHFALFWGHKKTSELLLRNGADPNSANKKGNTPLHIICQRSDDDDLLKIFFEIVDDIDQSVQIDARDKSGLTPLQWAVLNFLPNVVDVLLDRGADLSSFVFPAATYSRERTEFKHDFHGMDEFKMKLVPDTMAVVERLEKRGFELKQSDALEIIKIFVKHELFQRSGPLMRGGEEVYEYEEVTRKFIFRWTLEFFLLLTTYQLPILCCEKILAFLKCEDLLKICLAAEVFINDQRQNM
ncbi:unnamed protein product [Trichogramma brassicae]|uniref:Uncharacterized protein n=1 Tax=Trichogramma brassicae TaxID=86971 RepID=A0A6H5HSU7_9HYME|nr:unnamed protein product [Trichogramma brassicae]